MLQEKFIVPPFGGIGVRDPFSRGTFMNPDLCIGTPRSWTDSSEGAGGLVGSSAKANDDAPNPIAKTRTVERITPMYVSCFLITSSCDVVID